MSDLFNPPILTDQSVAFPGIPPGRLTWRCAYDLCEIVLDTKELDGHVDAAPDYLTWAMPFLALGINRAGWSLPDDDEYDDMTEVLENGWVRIYLVPTIPLDDAPLIPVPRSSEESAA
jgi:hypothetical protein